MKSILLFISLSLSVFINAQTSVQVYGTCEDAEIGKAIGIDNFNNHYILSDIKNKNYNPFSISLSKLNIGNQLIWTKAIYLDSNWQSMNAGPILCVDSFIFIAGTYYHNDSLFSTGYDIRTFLAKYSSDGELVWFKNTNKKSFENEKGCLEKVGEKLIYTSTSGSLTSYNDRKINITCLDTNGIVFWSKRLGGTTEVINDIQTLTDSTFVVLGSFKLNNNGGTKNFFIIKLNTSGNVLWEKSFADSSKSLQACAMSITSSGEIIITGFTSVNGSAILTKGFYAKLDALNGNLLLSKEITVPNTPMVFRKILSKNGSIYLVGTSTDMSGTSNFLSNVNITKIEENGVLNWMYTYNVSQYQHHYQYYGELISDAAIGSGIIYTLSTFLKYDPNHLSKFDLLKATIRTTGEATHKIDTLYPTINDVTLIPYDSLIFFNGLSFDSLHMVHESTLDYNLNFSNCVAVSVEDLTDNDFKLVVFPNPTSDYITIKTTKENIKYTLSDFKGKIMLQTTDKTIKIGDFAKGIYFLTYEFEGFLGTQKIILN